MPVVIRYNPKPATAAKIGVEGDVGNLLLLCGRVEANQTELLKDKQSTGKLYLGCPNGPASDADPETCCLEFCDIYCLHQFTSSVKDTGSGQTAGLGYFHSQDLR